jgi:para-aminobenzoate synthetase component 1
VTLAVSLAPAPDPFGTCVRLSGAGLPYLLFLDSSAQGALGHFSFLCADPVALIRAPNSVDPLEAARELLAPYAREPIPGLPPFQGGVAGYLGYDWGAELERVQRPVERSSRLTPDVVLGLYDWVIAWDHLEEKAWIISTGINPEAGGPKQENERAAARLAWVQHQLARATPAITEHSKPTPAPPQPNFTRAEFESGVRRIRDYIAAGDVYQVNFAQRFQAAFTGVPLALYRRLRARNPAPFGAYLDYDGTVVASISPERFLRVAAGSRIVEARPIKGTRPRGSTPAKDTALARALHASAKDRAENVMIVDLLRNDLGKVCRTGSVEVPRLLALESHPTVHHLVSTVTGVLRDDADAFDLIRAAFPGGSVTGAPKIRAMEIIAELERGPRGVYCGAIGYVSVTGAMDLNIPIRTIVLRGGEASFHAGAGIVWDSEPAAEYQETLAKARTMIEALTSPRRMPRIRGRAHPLA